MKETAITEIEFRNPYHITPPGALSQILSHPGVTGGVVELSLFHEHRYAFFYWNKWLRENKLSEPPCLVSLDWHQDLCYPCETEKEWLDKLDLSNDGEVSAFVWSKLNGLNDGHVLAAAYLNLIGNIYVHCRQGSTADAWDDEKLIDKYGNSHLIKKFKKFEDIENHMLQSQEKQVFLDIDLDFFVLDSGLHNGTFDFTYTEKDIINEMLDDERPLMKWIFRRLQGFTIATEPKHCGGILRSNNFLNIISELYFEPELFSQSCDWKWKFQD